MKHVVVLMVFVGCLVSVAFAQKEKEKLETGDSIRVAMERIRVSKELIQLRDSIKQTLAAFWVHIEKKKKTDSEGMRYRAARKELLKYQNQLRLGLEEIKLTSQKGWTKDSRDRILADAAVVRKNHKRICAMFQNTLVL